MIPKVSVASHHLQYCYEINVSIKLLFFSTIDVVFKIVQISHVHRTDNERSYNDITRYVRFQDQRDPRDGWRIPVRSNHSNRYEGVLNVGLNYERGYNHYQQQRNANNHQRSGGGVGNYGYHIVCYACGKSKVPSYDVTTFFWISMAFSQMLATLKKTFHRGEITTKHGNQLSKTSMKLGNSRIRAKGALRSFMTMV